MTPSLHFYIAARSQDAAIQLKQELESRGHVCTARWISDATFDKKKTFEEKQTAAIMDLEDVLEAKDGLILLSEVEGVMVPGGKHVEMGFALAHRHPIYVVGRLENTLQFHPAVKHCPTLSDFLRLLPSSDTERGKTTLPSATQR
jgi:hypothetical protein